MKDIAITREAHDKLWAYIDAIDVEIGGFGYIHRGEDQWVWHETFLVDQTVSAGDVEYDSDALGQAVTKAADDGVLTDPNFTWVMWHSHHSMGAFWSSTDIKEQINMMRDKSGVSHLVSLVGNHKHEYDLRLDLFDHPLVPHISFTEQELKVLAQEGVEAQVKADIGKHVTRWKPKTWTKPLKKNTMQQLPPPRHFDSSSGLVDNPDWDDMDEEQLDRILSYHGFETFGVSRDERMS